MVLAATRMQPPSRMPSLITFASSATRFVISAPTAPVLEDSHRGGGKRRGEGGRAWCRDVRHRHRLHLLRIRFPGVLRTAHGRVPSRACSARATTQHGRVRSSGHRRRRSVKRPRSRIPFGVVRGERRSAPSSPLYGTATGNRALAYEYRPAADQGGTRTPQRPADGAGRRFWPPWRSTLVHRHRDRAVLRDHARQPASPEGPEPRPVPAVRGPTQSNGAVRRPRPARLLRGDAVRHVRLLGSKLGGHPDLHKLPGIEANTGALGHGLSIATGMALGLRAATNGGRVFTVPDSRLPKGHELEGASIANTTDSTTSSLSSMSTDACRSPGRPSRS